MEIEAERTRRIAGEARIELSAEKESDLDRHDVAQHQRKQHDDPRRVARAAARSMADAARWRSGSPMRAAGAIASL